MSATNASREHPEAKTDPATILVAEDEILIRAMVAQHLRSAGFRILEASNAREAIEILSSGEAVDVVFTDVRMEDRTDGLRLAQWVRENHPAVCIVFASGEKNLGDAFPGARIFCKPYDMDQVESYIRSVIPDCG
jgi:DNA-binding NtrC family response regulator